MIFNYKGTEYPLATTLRVAYIIQGQNNHKNYLDIFEEIDKLPLEKQIGIIYASFQAANPIESKTISAKDFINYYLDNCDLSTLMSTIQDIIEGIIGGATTKTDNEDLEVAVSDVGEDNDTDFLLGTAYSEEPLKVD